jgi:inositol transport system substrate-binding protein
MRRSKLWSFVLIIGLVSALLAGCGSNSGNSHESAAAASPSAEPASTDAAAKKDTIVIGAAMPVFDDKWLSYLYDAINKYDKEHDEVEVKMVDAKNDSGKQLSQVETFVTQKVDAIIITPVETEAVEPMLDAANAANIPVVIVNRMPGEAAMAKAFAYVGSESLEAGTIEMEEVAKLLGGKGNVAIMNGTLGQESVVKRTEGNKNVLAKNPDMKLIREATANYQRADGMTLMENWIQSGDKIDAVVSNNDEMAIGAIMALEAAGKLDGVIVAGVDGTMDALEYVKSGKLQVTVYQNANGQGQKGIETAVKAARGEKIDDKMVWVPFELVTKDNYEEYVKKWQG